MNLIKEIKKIQDQEFKEKWNNHSNIIKFHAALVIALLIRKGDNAKVAEVDMIRVQLVSLAEDYGLKVIKKRETDGTWEG